MRAAATTRAPFRLALQLAAGRSRAAAASASASARYPSLATVEGRRHRGGVRDPRAAVAVDVDAASASASTAAAAEMPENDPAAVPAAAGRPSSSARGGKERHAVHTLAGFRVEGVSVGGQETCVILPQLKIAFDSGRCPQRAVYADTLCLSHTHMDHVGGAGFYIASRALVSLPPPSVLIPAEARSVLAPVPVRPRRRGERRSSRTFSPGASLLPGSLGLNPDAHASTPFNSASDAFELHF